MTKRDSVFAGIDSPRAPTSMQRRQFNIQWPSRSGAASSNDASRPSTAMGNWPQEPHQGPGMDANDMTSHAHHYGYTVTRQ